MPLTQEAWILARDKFEHKHLMSCKYLQRIGGNQERCSSVNGDINVYLVWATQIVLLTLALPLICHKLVSYGMGRTSAIHQYEKNHQRCTTDAYPIERSLIPFGMLLFLTYAFFGNLSNEVFTLFYFTFLTVSTQLVCNLVLILRAQYEWGNALECSHFSNSLRLYSQIVLAHTFACTAFIVAALLLFAATNQRLLHLFFIYKLLNESPTIIANELIHTVPVLVYLLLIKTHYEEDLRCTKRLIRQCTGIQSERRIKCGWNWYCLVLVLQIPSLSYIVLVDWNCVYGRLAMPFENDEVASAISYIVFGFASFTFLHHYLVHRILMGPQCTEDN